MNRREIRKRAREGEWTKYIGPMEVGQRFWFRRGGGRKIQYEVLEIEPAPDEGYDKMRYREVR